MPTTYEILIPAATGAILVSVAVTIITRRNRVHPTRRDVLKEVAQGLLIYVLINMNIYFLLWAVLGYAAR